MKECSNCKKSVYCKSKQGSHKYCFDEITGTAKITYLYGDYYSYIVHKATDCKDNTDKSCYKTLIETNEPYILIGKVIAEKTK